MQNTISIHVGNTSSIIHNNRKTENHTNPDIDVSRSGDNITLVQENIKDSYEKLFGQAVDEYNGKQKRADRKINNYLQKVKDSALDHQKEFIMQIGDYQSLEKIAEEQGCKVWETQEWQLRAETLKQTVLDFQVQNPNLYVYNAVIHLDELNPHAHVNFIPVGENMKKGLSKQVSMNRALENMGYDAKFEVSSEAKNVKERGRIKLDNSKNFKNWRDDNLERVKEIAKEVYKKAGHEFEFVEGDKSNQHESVQAYKKTVEAAKEKSNEIMQEARQNAMRLVDSLEDSQTRALAEDWKEEWLETKKEFPDFGMKVTVFDDENSDIPKMISVDEHTPIKFNFDFDQILNLFREKFSRLKSFIALEWQKITHREQEVSKRENTLSEKETSLESKIEAFKDKEQKFINLDKDLTKYKHELIDQMEPLLFSRYDDVEGVNKVIDGLRRDEISIDRVLSIFNQTFIGYEVDEVKMAKIDKEINDAEKAIQYIKDALDPNTNYAFMDIDRAIKLGFGNPSEENAWSVHQKLKYLDTHGYHHEGVNKPFPWKLSAIEQYRDDWVAKKKALSADKTKFVSKLHNTVQNIEKVKEQKALELAKKIVPKGPTMRL
ncbi:plasmid recombination protein [Lactococcus lactis]|uniref:plasmid recombination protein n=1 Tax=Lactococcus lactis TaxID=1358 RepID=UPI0022E96AF7|nr:plasmid recombination protein [Lactococcus lactis]